MSSKLTTCPTCGNSVAKSAVRCPHCGEILRHPIKNFLSTCFIIAFIFFAATVFFTYFDNSTVNSQYSSLSKEDYIARCETVDYKSVERYPDQYKGRLITLTGNVIQVVEGSPVILRINQKNTLNYTWYATYTPAQGESRILENDIITVYGECQGVESYQSVSDAQVTIPSLIIRYYSFEN